MKMLRSLLLLICLTLPMSVFAEISVNINTADRDTLVSMLNGVGEKKADAIIAYREENGPFNSIEELTNVNGIGENTLEKNQEILTTGEQ